MVRLGAFTGLGHLKMGAAHHARRNGAHLSAEQVLCCRHAAFGPLHHGAQPGAPGGVGCRAVRWRAHAPSRALRRPVPVAVAVSHVCNEPTLKCKRPPMCPTSPAASSPGAQNYIFTMQKLFFTSRDCGSAAVREIFSISEIIFYIEE